MNMMLENSTMMRSGGDRSGVLRIKRQVETTGGELRKIVENGILLIRNDESWELAGEGGGKVRLKDEKADHRLPEITALISPDQFRAITHPESSTVLLQGGAGSGKTTVGLHRIAYLTYRDTEHFQPDRVLVVMFNRSLQHYISRVLPELESAPAFKWRPTMVGPENCSDQPGCTLPTAPMQCPQR